jgi:hypothetical protein
LACDGFICLSLGNQSGERRFLTFPREFEGIDQFRLHKLDFMPGMVILYQTGCTAVGLACQRVIHAEMNPAVNWPDRINSALPVFSQKLTGIFTGFIKPESPLLCQKAIDQFDLRTGDTGFTPADGRPAAVGIALV